MDKEKETKTSFWGKGWEGWGRGEEFLPSVFTTLIHLPISSSLLKRCSLTSSWCGAALNSTSGLLCPLPIELSQVAMHVPCCLPTPTPISLVGQSRKVKCLLPVLCPWFSRIWIAWQLHLCLPPCWDTRHIPPWALGSWHGVYQFQNWSDIGWDLGKETPHLESFWDLLFVCRYLQ